MQEVTLQDLLGQDPVQLNLDSVKCQIAGRVIMVTGAAASIRSEICRQLLSYGPSKLICVDHAENPLFFLQHATSDFKVEKAYFVADITDRADTLGSKAKILRFRVTGSGIRSLRAGVTGHGRASSVRFRSVHQSNCRRIKQREPQ